MGSIIPYSKEMILKSGSASIDLSTIEYFTEDEVRQIVEFLGNRETRFRKNERERYYLYMQFLLRTGGRRNEVLNIMPENIDLQANTVRLITLKKKKKKPDDEPPIRVVPLHPDLRDALMSYMLEHSVQKGKRIFPMRPETASNFFIAMGKKLGFGVHIHKFRHTFGVRALSDGVPINVVQKWMGHSSIFTTTVYTELGATDTQGWMQQVR